MLEFENQAGDIEVKDVEVYESHSLLSIMREIYEKIFLASTSRALLESPGERRVILMNALGKRIDRINERHPHVKKGDVDAAFMFEPELYRLLLEMEAKGHEPDLLREDEEAYYFGTCSKEVPQSTRNVVFDSEAQMKFNRLYKELRCDRNAKDLAGNMGVSLMTEEIYRQLQTFGSFDEKTWSYLWTPPDVRARGEARVGSRPLTGGPVAVGSSAAHHRRKRGGFRVMLRVPKKAPEKAKLMEGLETFLSTILERFDANKHQIPCHTPENRAKLEAKLRANPEKLVALKWMEDTGGAPDVTGMEGEVLLFDEVPGNFPDARKGLTYPQAVEMVRSFGGGARLMRPERFKLLVRDMDIEIQIPEAFYLFSLEV